MWKSEERNKEMTAPITLQPLDEQTLTDLRRRYDETSDAETRTRYQMLLLSAKGQTSTQIARLVLRSQDTVVRVLASQVDWMPSPDELHQAESERSQQPGKLS